MANILWGSPDYCAPASADLHLLIVARKKYGRFFFSPTIGIFRLLSLLMAHAWFVHPQMKPSQNEVWGPTTRSLVSIDLFGRSCFKEWRRLVALLDKNENVPHFKFFESRIELLIINSKLEQNILKIEIVLGISNMIKIGRLLKY